jgi:hypothetical protein
VVRLSDDQPSLKLRPDNEDAAQRRSWTSYFAVKKNGETDEAHPKNSGPISQELIERLRNAVTYYNYRYFSETLLCRQYGMVGMAERNTTEFNSGRASCGVVARLRRLYEEPWVLVARKPPQHS